MPRIPQILFWLWIHSKAKLSTSSKTPEVLWGERRSKNIIKLVKINWYDEYQSLHLTFKIKPLNKDTSKLPILLTTFYVNPQWQLTTPFEQEIERLWETNKKILSPNLITTPEALLIHNSNENSSPLRWFLVKQNDPDIQRLLAARIIEKKPLIPPYSSFSLIPIGVTQPIIVPKRKDWYPETFNLDPTSRKITKGGHNVTQKLCHSNGFLTRPEINLSWVIRQGRLNETGGLMPQH